MNRMARNERFLRNIYARGEMQGHAFACATPGKAIWAGDGDFTLSDKPVANWVADLVEHYHEQVRVLEELDGDHVPVAKLGTGTHIYAAAFGSPVKQFNDANPFALPFVDTAGQADAIEQPGVFDSPVIERIFELGRLVRRELGEDAYLGPPDMQTGFDTACLIWDKSALYMAMADPDESAAVHRLVDKCARFYKKVLLELHREFPNMSRCHCPGTWSPPELGPWMSNDECGAISAEMFQRYCLPELIDLAETFGGIGMHCCAAAEHQFESFKKIPGFYGFNRVAATQGWRPIIESFDGSDNTPVMVLAWVPDADMDMLVREAPAGMRFIFHREIEDLDDGRRWLERGRRLNELVKSAGPSGASAS